MGVFSDLPELKGVMYFSTTQRDAAEKKVHADRAAVKQEEELAKAKAELEAKEKAERTRKNREAREENAKRLLARAAQRAQAVNGDAESLADRLGEKIRLAEQESTELKERQKKAAQERLEAARAKAAAKEAERQRLAAEGAARKPVKVEAGMTLLEKMAAKRREQDVGAEKRWLKQQILNGAIEVEKQGDGQFLLKHGEKTAAADKKLLTKGLGGVAGVDMR